MDSPTGARGMAFGPGPVADGEAPRSRPQIILSPGPKFGAGSGPLRPGVASVGAGMNGFRAGGSV